jgi:hypothetical protein
MKLKNVTGVEAVPVINAQFEQALATFDPVAAGIEELRAKATGLQIEGIDDTEGYALVRSTRRAAGLTRPWKRNGGGL